MTTHLQKAAQALIDRWDSPAWKDQPHTAEYILILRKALDDEIAQAVEPRWYACDTPGAEFDITFVTTREEAEENVEYALADDPDLTFEDVVTPLYLHPPQPQATTPADKPTDWSAA